MIFSKAVFFTMLALMILSYATWGLGGFVAFVLLAAFVKFLAL